jgi:ABC-type sugar transport system ATPase subunit
MIYVTHDQTEAMTLADRLVVLHQGEALQEGRPLEVYDRPRNQFVAGFLGWPPMNFLTGRLARDGDTCLRLEGKGARVSLAGVELPPGATDRELTLGVRPENVRLSEPGDESSTTPLTLTMEVSAVERLGGHCLVTLRRGDWRLTARCDGACSLVERQTAAVELDPSRLHWFDPTSGTALAPSFLAGGRTR